MATNIYEDYEEKSSSVSELDQCNQSIISKFDCLSQKHKLQPDLNNSIDDNDFIDKDYFTITDHIGRKEKHEQFIAEQKFECQVTEVYDDEFLFKAIDTEGKEKDFGYKFQKTDVPQEDRDLIEVGAIFYWSIGYFESSSTISKQIDIRFRRIVDWTEEDNNIALNNAGNLINELGWPEN